MQTSAVYSVINPAFRAGLFLGLSLIMALGPQNVHVIRMGLNRHHVGLTLGICLISDALLISAGVLGMGQITQGIHGLQQAFMVLGIVFLLTYGNRAFTRFRAAGFGTPPSITDRATDAMTRRQATLSALAFTWLNPHAWLDTTVLIGAASMAWEAPGNIVFGIGAVSGSALWFGGLGLAVLWLGKRLQSPRIWRTLDALVALMMWLTALTLGWKLLRG